MGQALSETHRPHIESQYELGQSTCYVIVKGEVVTGIRLCWAINP